MKIYICMNHHYTPNKKEKVAYERDSLTCYNSLICVAVQLWDSIFCFELLIGLLQITTVFLGNLMGNTWDTVNNYHIFLKDHTALLTSPIDSYSGMDEDISRLKTTAVGLLSDLGCNGSTLTEDLINEICRFGASELHAVSAFIGGIASQEVIKVLSLGLSNLDLSVYIKDQKVVEWWVFNHVWRAQSSQSTIVYIFKKLLKVLFHFMWSPKPIMTIVTFHCSS